MRRRRVLIVGGGCYGGHFAHSLARARRRGGESFDLWIVDRNENCPAGVEIDGDADRVVVAEWSVFLGSYLGGAAPERARRGRDLLVPSPLAPHLFADWLASRWEERPVDSIPFPISPELPYQKELLDGGRAISHADWLCPIHCIEPRLCPATRQLRDWELARSLLSLARRLRQIESAPCVGPLLAQCVHWREGVGVMVLGDWLVAAERAQRALGGGAGTVLAATTSSCHGVAHLLRIGELPPRGGGAPNAVGLP